MDRQIRATSFGSAADDYARYRPAPPAEAAEWAVGRSPGLVIDVAAGTGHLARHLLGRTNRVVAVDIDRRMLATLGNRLPGVARVVARGEELPFVSGAAGAVVISSAWHWLDPGQAWSEIARVVRPGGTFSVVSRCWAAGSAISARALPATARTAADGMWSCPRARRSRSWRNVRSPLPCLMRWRTCQAWSRLTAR